jgi:hypothetical protein
LVSLTRSVDILMCPSSATNDAGLPAVIVALHATLAEFGLAQSLSPHTVVWCGADFLVDFLAGVSILHQLVQTVLSVPSIGRFFSNLTRSERVATPQPINSLSRALSLSPGSYRLDLCRLHPLIFLHFFFVFRGWGGGGT